MCPSQCVGFVTCAQMLMYAIAHGGCADTVRQSALKTESGRKIPCHTGNRTRVIIVYAFLVRRYTNSAIPTSLKGRPAYK